MEHNSPKKKKKNIFSAAQKSLCHHFFPEKKKIIPSLPMDCLALLTHSLCTQKPEKIKHQHIQDTITNIKHFSWVNRQSYHYYHRDVVVKEMIKKIAGTYGVSDLSIAILFRAHHIKAKLDDLMDKVQDKDDVFSREDLQDLWYLNASFNSVIQWTPVYLQTLLFVAVWNGDAIKVESLINAGADYKSHKLIALLAHKEHGLFLTQGGNFKILKLLLTCKEDPDDRYSRNNLTLLQLAALYNDKSLAHLLLSHGANPWKAHVSPRFTYEELCDNSNISLLYMHLATDAEPWKDNAFTLERGEPKGWLMAMYEKMVESKALKTTLSLTDQSVQK